MPKQNLGRKAPQQQKKKAVDTRVEMLKQIAAGNENVPFMYRCEKCGKQVMDDDREFMISFSKLHV